MLLYKFPGDQLVTVNATWTSVPVSVSGTITSLTVNRQVAFRLGQLAYLYLDFTINTNGTGATAIRVLTPIGFHAPITGTRYQTLLGRELALAPQLLCVIAGTTMDIFSLTGAYPGGTGRRLVVSGYYIT